MSVSPAPASPADATGGPHGPSYVSHADLALSFDDYYKSARDRLLLQTFALTGDLAVARSAVREAFVVAWHHWRKTARFDDPEGYVRPLAWRKAQRRTTALPLRRRKDLDPEVREVIDALDALTVTQRRALLLTQLAGVSLADMAHEVGLAAETAERELQLGAAQFATQLAIPTSHIHLMLAALADATRSVTWPRATIIRRAGAARRRAHTVIGGATAVVALVAGGAVALDSTGSRPTLDREPPPAASTTLPSGPAVNRLPDTALLPLETVRTTLPARGWAEGRTGDNSTGNGHALPCQSTRYADPKGNAAWVRSFRNGTRSSASRTFVQFAEASVSEPRATRTYQRTLRWFTACQAPADDASAIPRVQLVSTWDVAGVGDQSALLVLRSRVAQETYVVGVARSGLFTTTTSLTATVPKGQANEEGVAALLATAVDRLCTLADGGACADDPAPKVTARPAYPVGRTPWFVSEVDLPPLERDQGPWVGTPAAKLSADRNDTGAIGCDIVRLFGSFRDQEVKGNQFRTFVLSASDLPTTVGLTQTVGSLPPRAARRFVERVREQMAACPDLDASAGTEVTEIAGDGADTSLSAWHLSTALPNDETLEGDVAVVRSGTSLSVLVYVAAPGAGMADGDFADLARRARERLSRMDAYEG
ncbi:hypothetical protein ACFQ0K_04310 [Nocardioides caeni]|uniref:RNA polymerase sigma factor 70 region 4 type 2 domain-containing protein n=1 Tax=Nocardioides caeni TaxID=574700 RepID=A0A4S8N743_9ACTN|nr:hypothetical protein [Nocardioides caeni]THV10739.1 hypothetical protein E9934_13440 [Nocardioides caeni]